MADASGSITAWLRKIATGDSIAEQEIWAAYAKQVEACARTALAGAKKREFDEEDITTAVLNSLFEGLKNGKIRPINNRRHLLALLKEMARRKTLEAKRKQTTKKRGGGKVRGDSGFKAPDQASGDPGINAVSDNQPDAVEALARAEAFAQLLDTLKDTQLKRIAALKVAKFTNGEIAARLELSERTIERKVSSIKEIFSEQLNKAR